MLKFHHSVAGRVEATVRFELTNRGFADPRLRPLGYVASESCGAEGENVWGRANLPSSVLLGSSCICDPWHGSGLILLCDAPCRQVRRQPKSTVWRLAEGLIPLATLFPRH